jgi:hypothetical protein
MTENHFSPYPRSEGDINLYTVLGSKSQLQGKHAKNCRPTAVRKLVILPAYGCNISARLPGKAAGQGCLARLPG